LVLEELMVLLDFVSTICVEISFVKTLPFFSSPLVPWRAPCIYRHERSLEGLMKEFGKNKERETSLQLSFFAVTSALSLLNSALSLLILHYKDVAWFCIHSRGFPFVHKKESFIFVSL